MIEILFSAILLAIMVSIFPLIRWAFDYGFHVFAASLMGALPPAMFFFAVGWSSPDATFYQLLELACLTGLACLVTVILPFCFFIAAPLAILANHFVKLTFARSILLAFLLTVPGIIFLDYVMYRSSGVDSGPPSEPYSLLHFVNASSSVYDFFLMVILPLTSAIFCALTLWYLRFRESKDPKNSCATTSQ